MEMSKIAIPKLSDYERGLVPPSLLAVDSESTTSFPTTDSCSTSDDNPHNNGPTPLAICGIATRLPGGISSAEQLWEFLLNKRDGCSRIPAERYATHLPDGDAATGDRESADGISSDMPHWKTHGYMLDHVDLAAFDSSLFSMTRAELGIVDPQQRILLELTRECFESAGETGWRGKDIGVYIGTFGEDWNDLQYHDRQDLHLYKLTGAGDYVLSNRISYEYDLKGPSLVLRTGCSASLYGLHLACKALQAGEIPSALIGGCNLIMNPSKVETMFTVGVLSKGASSRSFDAAADGYARGEAVSMIYVKRLDDALRDGNPIRAVIRGTASNCDGKTPGLTKPSREAHETLIRAAYAAAGLDNDIHKTGFFECHATGTSSGDPEEAKAVASVFGNKGGVYIGSVKPNLGHSEGASGITSLLKCVMALENKTIPPNIKFEKPNPNIPFAEGGLRVPTDAVQWPQDRDERASVNSFGVGGANAHVILDSAASFGIRKADGNVPRGNRLLVFTANDIESAHRGSQECSNFIANCPHELNDTAYTLGIRREHLSCRSFAAVDGTNTKDVTFSIPVKTPTFTPSVAFIFTGQGAQWPTMGAALLSEYPAAMHDIEVMQKALSTLGQDLAPNWSLSGM
ncbi:phenolpthiocerol synthesis polyketide synthase ppsA [Xylaria cf. heliscus]|nr:phenolpthiocerol synthesis polyketide synthase ppsA [Xylaria cf. heliscus]